MTDGVRDRVEEEARRLEEECLYTEKTHFVATRGWTILHYLFGLPSVVLAAVAGTLAFERWDATGFWIGWISVAVAILAAVVTFLSPSKKAATHHNKGCDYGALRGKVRRFQNVGCHLESGRDHSALAADLEELANHKAELDKRDPPAPTWAYRMARWGIRSGQAAYDVDRTAENSGT